jgi:tRNA pseudouridine synthase 10
LLYRESDEFLQEILHQVNPQVPPTVPGNICVSCQGVLQRAADAESLDGITMAMAKSGYQYADYTLCITLPWSVYVRTASIWLYLREKYFSKDTPEGQKNATVAEHERLFADDLSESTVLDVKECLKWIVSSHVKEQLGTDFKWLSDFKVLLNYSHPSADDEIEFLTKFDGSPLRQRRKRERAAFVSSTGAPQPPEKPDVSIPNLQKALALIPGPVFLKTGKCPPEAVQVRASRDISFERNPMFLAGRYSKRCRDLSQTPWLLEGRRMSEDSVEELISPHVQQRARCDAITFSSAGREDVDVRMLSGRPFVLELSNARQGDLNDANLAEVQDAINRATTRIAVSDLQRITKNEVNYLKEGEEDKKKTYRCVVWLSRHVTAADLQKLNESKELTVQQRTPIRVLHRRSLAMRPKLIHSMRCDAIGGHFFMLDLVTQAGTYIKEFVHGDWGRTIPNVGTLLGCEADILQLDVLSIDLDFPPTLASQ